MSENIRKPKKKSPNIDSVVRAIEARTDLNPKIIKRILTVFVDEVPKFLVDNGSLVIMNLGVFTLRLRHNSINPKTQELLTKPSLSLTFKQSKSLKQAILREKGDAKEELLALAEQQAEEFLSKKETKKSKIKGSKSLTTKEVKSKK